MPPIFHPRLINNPFDDPGVFVPFLFEKRAIIFDLGDNTVLSTRDLLKISHAFVTHTHMDHFIGFDRLLRLLLGRDKTLYIYGPEGFLNNIEGKLAGYTWNLVENFTNDVTLTATEVHPNQTVTRIYRCSNRFKPDPETTISTFSGLLLREPALLVSAILLDHQIPCLGYCIEENFHININKQQLEAMGLEPGPWLNEFKQAIYNKQSPDTRIQVFCSGNETVQKEFKLGELADRIAIYTPGQKVAYITDVAGSAENREKLIAFVKNSDYLFIEAAFLYEDKDIAEKKHHLTARQAGEIASIAKVKNMTIFHFSPRYTGKEKLLEKEAMTAFQTDGPIPEV
jgi:ribonuclease Z